MKKFLSSILLLFALASPVFAMEDRIKGRIEAINVVDCDESLDQYICYTYDVFIKSTSATVTTMSVMLEPTEKPLQVGDNVFVTGMQDFSGEFVWSVVGYDRANMILIFTIIFVVMALFVAGRSSLGSIVSLILSFLVIYVFTIPQLISSKNVLLIGYISVFILLTISMYLAHGFKKQTTIALLSTYLGIFLVSVVAWIFMEVLHVNGMGEENTFYLSVQADGLDIPKLFFISILISAVGVLDDVAIGQVASMYEIYTANTNISAYDLFKKSMNVGREHVASMINTLFIVYAGSSLSLVMLLYISGLDIGTLVSMDLITEEIVRTLAISIALLLVVPISTYIGANILKKEQL
jgi:uncharacterized membrane protein